MADLRDPYRIQYDEHGRPYLELPGQGRNYISPQAFGEDAPEDTTGIFRQRPQWDQNQGEYETPIDWGNIMNLAVGGGLGASVASAAGLLGGAGGAGGGSSAGLGPVAAGGGTTAAVAPPAALASGGGAGMGGGFTGWLAKNGLNLALGGMSMLGDDEPESDMKSFDGTAVDPEKVLGGVLSNSSKLRNQIASRAPTKLRETRGASAPIAPVSIPELGVQIGGAFHRDYLPEQAMTDEGVTDPIDPLGSVGQSKPQPSARRRNPNG